MHSLFSCVDSGLFARLPSELMPLIERYGEHLNALRTSPYLKEELQSLLTLRSNISITYSRDRRCAVVRYNTWSLHKGNLNASMMIPSEEISIDYQNNNEVSCSGDCVDAWPVWIVASLEHRRETSVQDSRHWITDDARANVVLLDIRSVFLLMKDRLLRVNDLGPAMLARRLTLAFLDEVVFHFQGRELSLALYLLGSAANLELEIPEIAVKTSTRDEKMDAARATCSEYYTLLRKVVNAMTY